LQRAFGVRRVRTTRTLYSAEDRPVGGKTLLAKRLWHFCLRNFYRTRTTAGLTSFSTFVELLKRNHLPKLRTLELMCHPGHPYSAKETDLLKSDWRSLSGTSLELISYASL
jgi:predicted glycoside hydrolase/deacetylase ChbG (UPF0249 family)